MGRILAIDFGTKRTGIAVSDPARIIAGGLETVPTARLHDWLSAYFSANEVDIIVIGKPVQMSGAPSDTYAKVIELERKLRKDYPAKAVVLFDERFTSVLAQRAMIDGGMRKMQRRDKAAVDRISATIILQGFMESRYYDEIKAADTSR